MDDALSDQEIQTLVESYPWSEDETTDFVRVCEREGIPLRHIVKHMDAAAKLSMPLISPYTLSRALRANGIIPRQDEDDGG